MTGGFRIILSKTFIEIPEPEWVFKELCSFPLQGKDLEKMSFSFSDFDFNSNDLNGIKGCNQ